MLAINILHWDTTALTLNNKLHYRGAIQKLNFFNNIILPNIPYAAHQWTHLSEYLMAPHGDTVKFWFATRDQPKMTELFYIPRKTIYWKFLQMTISVETGTIQQTPKMSELKNHILTMWYFTWVEQLYVFKVTYANRVNNDLYEYIDITYSLWYCIPFILLLHEIKIKGVKTLYIYLKIYWKSFKDNSGALELAYMPKLQLCTRHNNTIYHPFQ